MDCYSCKHRGTVPGSAHSQCDQGLTQIFSGATPTIRVSLNDHGVKMGWATWPFDFDPIWVDACNSQEKMVDTLAT